VTIPGWATSILPGPPNQSGMTVNFLVSSNNPTLFSGQPAIAPNGTLTFSPSGLAGSATVTVQLMNSGSTANGGVNTSGPQKFTITISGSSFFGTPNEAWVVQTYFDLLNRPISKGDLAFWTDQLEADVPRVTVASEIVNSSEYMTDSIVHLYQTLLNQNPSSAGVGAQLQFLGQGNTSEQLRAEFLSSPSYIHGHGQSNQFGWVNAVFQDELGHAADAVAQQYWVTQLQNSGFDFFNTALAILQTPEGVGQVVRQLYVNMLGHPVDPAAGLNPWFVALENGATDQQVIAGIVSSPEYFVRPRSLWNVPALQAWVTQMYLDTLGRSVDPTGMGTWVGALEGGASRLDIMELVVRSLEFRVHAVNTAYQQTLHRAADPTGMNAALQLLGGSGTLEQVKASLMGSAEYYFARGGGTDGGFLTAVLSDALSQPPAGVQGGVAFWGNVLAGDTRSDVALQILQNVSAEEAFVEGLFLSLLKRSSGGGNAFWAGQILGGMRAEDVVANIVASREYFTKF
jgi:hypothetical protein